MHQLPTLLHGRQYWSRGTSRSAVFSPLRRTEDRTGAYHKGDRAICKINLLEDPCGQLYCKSFDNYLTWTVIQRWDPVILTSFLKSTVQRDSELKSSRSRLKAPRSCPSEVEGTSHPTERRMSLANGSSAEVSRRAARSCPHFRMVSPFDPFGWRAL